MTTNSMATIDVASCQQRIEEYMQGWLNRSTVSPRLQTAMSYSVLGGGKRLRPLLVYATGLGLGADLETLDPAAAAVEFIHCYSLVHDDLPAMDNDDLRRGRPTCHKAYDEATAILVGDALQTLAFTVLSAPHEQWSLQHQLAAIRLLTEASGDSGMVGGQMLDMDAENKKISLSELEMLHRLKTGALIKASVGLGAVAAGCLDRDVLRQLDQFAANIGLAFQVQDDLLDVEGATEVLGKQAGADQILNKSTYPSLMGLDAAKQYLQSLYEQACQLVEKLPIDTHPLQQILSMLQNRQS